MTALILLKDFLETQIEIWRPAIGFLGYEVSNLGRVRSFWRKSGSGGIRGSRPHGTWTYVLGESPTMVEGVIDKDGYRRVSLRVVSGKYTKIGVHALVARAFVVNNRPLTVTHPNHKNNVHNDNRAWNLEWCTEKENRDHAIAIGVWPKGEQHGMARIGEMEVREIRKRHAEGESQSSLARVFGFTPPHISHIVHRRLWKDVW